MAKRKNSEMDNSCLVEVDYEKPKQSKLDATREHNIFVDDEDICTFGDPQSSEDPEDTTIIETANRVVVESRKMTLESRPGGNNN